MMGKRTSIAALAAGIAAAFLPWSGAAVAQQPTQSGAVALREVDIRAFIADVSNVTGRTFIIDPRVQGNVTVLAPHSLPERELFDVFLSTLRVHGFVAVPTATGAYRIVPDEVASRDASARQGQSAENRYVTQVFQLQFADAESVAATVRPMLSERGQVSASRRGNSVVLVDYGSTVTRLRDVIGQLDRDTSSFRSIRLRNSAASDMARLALSMATAVGEETGTRSLLQATPVQSSNTLVLRGDPALLDRLAQVLGELDAAAINDAAVQVIPLQYAVASELVPVLQQISASLTAPTGEGQPAAGRSANIASHQPTNSLIINASPDVQDALARVVRSLDVRREQILVEAIIVEVSDSAAQELGLQFLLSGNGDDAVPFLSTSYANAAPNLLAVTGALTVRDGDGDEESETVTELRRAAVRSLLGSSGALLGVGQQTNDGSILGLILNALAEDQDSNVLSTPSVMTLNNETASILVGQQIPITTGEALSGGNDNPFRTIQREDVGVELKVRPQISENGAIRLEISQEVSSIFGPIVQDSTDLITNRRAINTVVQVDPGQIIVLGGLIQEDVQRSQSGVPGLRNLPVAGRLFRNDNESRRRTNLMVFLRPTVVSSPEQARDVTMRQYEALRAYRGLDGGIRQQLDQQMGGVRQPALASQLPAAGADQSGSAAVGSTAPAGSANTSTSPQ
ncbi:MAG: type II secretion system secretin GspD [Caulobacterales bacterium]